MEPVTQQIFKPLPRLMTPLEGLGLGSFAFLAGALLFAEQFGLIPNIKWGVPLALCTFGVVTLIRVFKRLKTD